MILYNHLWDMFKIALANKSDNKVDGIDLFCKNCKSSCAIYKGAPNLDYKDLNKKINSTEDINKQIINLKNFVNKNCNVLNILFEAGNREDFDRFLNSNI